MDRLRSCQVTRKEIGMTLFIGIGQWVEALIALNMAEDVAETAK